MTKVEAKAPGKHYRDGVNLIELLAMFPDEATAEHWFEESIWPDGRRCSYCGNEKTREVPKRKPMPYWCPTCRKYFSVRSGTALARSNVPLRKWALAIYLCMTGLKSVSSMKLHRDIGVSQKTAWFMLMRIREAWATETDGPYKGPVEADETYFGGKRKSMHRWKREQLDGRGVAGKTAVAGLKDRDTNKVTAKVVREATGEVLQEFVTDHTTPDATVYTDESRAYRGLPRTHEAVKHSVGEFVRGKASTNGLESFWSMLKRAHTGTFHKMSPKHLDRYVKEFAGRHNIRELGTLAQMRDTVAGLVGRSLLYRELTADNGLSSGARS